MLSSADHQQNQIDSNEPIPLSQRRSALTMGLVWLTMVASFPAVLAGFEWYRQGISFYQLIFCVGISILLLLLYSIPACELGARTGLGYCALGRIIFGRWGMALLTINLLWIFVAWYGLTAVLMAQAVLNLFHCPIPLMYLSVMFAFLMSINNLFGFRGVANFARFWSGPILITWVLYVFFKALNEPVSAVVPEHPHPSILYALSLTSSFIIGFAVWGNEQDYWRYSKPGIWRSAIPLLVSIIIGQVLFPLAGWLIARSSGLSDHAVTSAFMSNYCFGSVALIGLLIITADYFSTNDSSLFGCAVAIENIWTLNHTVSVGIFAFLGALIAAILSATNMTESLTALVSLNCIILPTPTIIMITEWWLQKKVFGIQESFQAISEANQVPALRPPAIIGLLCGLTIGIASSGLIPSLEIFHFGICSLNAWLISILVYVPLRVLEYNQKVRVTVTVKSNN